jgi:hypothetical protein
VLVTREAAAVVVLPERPVRPERVAASGAVFHQRAVVQITRPVSRLISSLNDLIQPAIPAPLRP